MIVLLLILLVLILFTRKLSILKRQKKYSPSLKDFEIYVICLNDIKNQQLKRLFPNKRINIQTGVDLRNVSTENLVKSQIINESTYNTIINGRTYHHDIGTHGAIGLAWANKLVFDKGGCDLFLLEEDYNIVDANKFLHEFDMLQCNCDKFDVAVFGGIIRRKDAQGDNHNIKQVPWMPDGWTDLNGGRFFLTHAVYYTSSGRKKLRDLLLKDPIDMQIDSLYSEWAAKYDIKILVQYRYKTIQQVTNRKTTIQTDGCKSCK